MKSLIIAIDGPSGTPVLIKSTNKAPVGNVEVLTRSTASGWVFDPDNSAGPVTVVFVVALLLILTVGGVLFFAAADIARYLRIRRM